MLGLTGGSRGMREFKGAQQGCSRVCSAPPSSTGGGTFFIMGWPKFKAVKFQHRIKKTVGIKMVRIKKTVKLND